MSSIESLLRWIYEKSPVWLQNVACSAAGIKIKRERYNKVFHSSLRFLEESQWWSISNQKAYQDEQLRDLVRLAYDNVPYYRKLFRLCSLKPSDVKNSDDLSKLPILHKSVLRDHFEDLRYVGWPKSRLVLGHTGGTTGTALTLVYDIDTRAWQWAVWWRHRKRFSLKLGDPFIVFGGRPVVPMTCMEPPFWRRNLPLKQTYVSSHHMTKSNMEALVTYLNRRHVAYYAGYPSALYLLAIHLLENGIRLLTPPRITVTGAETVLPYQRTAIETAFQTEVADQYGASEYCCNISECEYHSYHVDMEFGIIEFLPIPGMPDNVRRIVCTGLKNPVMPLIRYDIGDIATLSHKKCPCGRESPVIDQIDGRIESYIVTPDGRRLGRLDFLFKTTVHVKEAQLIQNDLYHLIIRVVRGQHYNSKDEQMLLSDLRSYVGDQISIALDYVTEIPRERNGKFRQIVSKVSHDLFKQRDIEY